MSTQRPSRSPSRRIGLAPISRSLSSISSTIDFTWRDADDLFELARFVGCTRPGYTMDEATIASIPADRVTMVEIPALAISSTDCRERTRRGEPVWYLVPDGVVQYIAKHDLYPKDQE